MKSVLSCLGSFLLLLVILVLVRFLVPELWVILVALARGAFFTGLGLFLVIVVLIGYFTSKNLKANRAKGIAEQYSRVTKTEALYRKVSELLQKNFSLHSIGPDELLRSEVLIQDTLPKIKEDLIRLKDFSSTKNERVLSDQIRDYKKKVQRSADPSVRQVMEENLRMLEEKRNRMQQAVEQIREKEGLLDLIYNQLQDIEEDLQFGRPVQKMFPDEIYQRARLLPPSEENLS